MRTRLAGVLAITALAISCAPPPDLGPPRTTSAPLITVWRPPDERAATALGFASAQVGKRYCWGGTGPNCFDCSGLVQAAWRSAGVRLPRTSTDQAHALAEVRVEDVQPGDVLWWPHHVGLYAGNGEMIDAYHSGAGVVRRPAVVPEKVLRVAR